VDAPATARRVVADALVERVPAPVIERAKLTISELITNSVCHSAGGYAVVRLHLTDERLRLEVSDRGQGDAIVRRPADARTGRGFGLQVIETLSERWGSERHASGATCVWAELSPTADAGTSPRQPAPPPGAEVHVVPESRTGRWGVHLDPDAPALSEHASETAAEAAARAQAALYASGRVVVHDRYFRTHVTSPRTSPAGDDRTG
jgi:anti-sigma regulatory factor (Ser/Thr protein kinase)